MRTQRIVRLVGVSALSVAGLLLLGGTASAAPARLKISDSISTESASVLKFKVTLTKPAERRVVVSWATADGTGPSDESNAFAGEDYQQADGKAVIPTGKTKAIVSVTPIGDDLDDRDRALGVELSAPRGATIADGSGTGTITDDDDPPIVTLAPATQNVNEPIGVGEEAQVVWTVTLSEPSKRTVYVDTSMSGTATKNVDYTTLHDGGTWIFSPGDTVRGPSAKVLGDNDYVENDETIIVSLANPDGATLGAPSTASATIIAYLP